MDEYIELLRHTRDVERLYNKSNELTPNFRALFKKYKSTFNNFNPDVFEDFRFLISIIANMHEVVKQHKQGVIKYYYINNVAHVRYLITYDEYEIDIRRNNITYSRTNIK